MAVIVNVLEAYWSYSFFPLLLALPSAPVPPA